MLTSLQTQAIVLTESFFKKADEIYSTEFPKCQVLFNLKGACAGTALSKYSDKNANIIRYNSGLLLQEQDRFLESVVPHEVAHIVAERLFGGRGNNVNHGYAWRQVMRQFGVDPERCHDFDVTDHARTRNVKKFLFKCDCQSHEMSSIAAKRMANGGIYTCRVCKSKLVKVWYE